MLYYMLFILVMPALVYVDYRSYIRKMERILAEQPDYAENTVNYRKLLEKLTRRQKQTSVFVCILLILIAVILMFLAPL